MTSLRSIVQSDRENAVRIHLLGPVSVSVEGRLHNVRANKVRTLLATLALDAGRAVSNEDLADELWAGEPVANTRNALQAHATRLRKVLGSSGGRFEAGAVRAVHGGYLLEAPPECVDANRFLELAARGAAELPVRPESALALLERSLDLWRGPALLDAGDGLRVRSAAALFDERRITAWENLVSALLSLGDDARAIAELRQLVARYPLRERFCELLMLALYRASRQGEALDLFRSTRQRLDEELGIRPGTLLRRRHAEILAQDPALSLRTAALPCRPEPSVFGL